MSVGRTWGISLLGIDGVPVEVEADVSRSLPRLVIIGLADRSLSEAEGRVRLAAANSDCRLPNGRITVNLSPASLPKGGAGFDLAIAVACLAADSRVRLDSVAAVVHLGELALDGRLRPTRGILPSVRAAVRAGHSTIMVPSGNAAEARLVPAAEVVPVASLRDAAIWHGAQLEPVAVNALIAEDTTLAERVRAAPDLGDVWGQEDAVRALVVAAAGGHHLWMSGPPGSGKTMLAERLPGILPDLSVDEALDVASVRSLSGDVPLEHVDRRPPWESPHHSASLSALIGGGTGLIRPGAAARAAHGVLFLDEASEFPGHTLDALRQPLESGEIVIHRVVGSARFPGAFQLVLASNPCPCGYFGDRTHDCRCTPAEVRRYRSRLSGPLIDRVDIRLGVRPVSAAVLHDAQTRDNLTTAHARAAVDAARERSTSRLADTPWATNAQVPGSWLRDPDHALSRELVRPLDAALATGQLSMRGYDRVLRIAWTLGDLDGVTAPQPEHLGEALYLRGRGVQ